MANKFEIVLWKSNFKMINDSDLLDIQLQIHGSRIIQIHIYIYTLLSTTP